MDSKTILANQVLIMKVLMILTDNFALSKLLQDQILFTEGRIRDSV